MGKSLFMEDTDDDSEDMERNQAKKILSINVPFQNSAVILMNHPASLYLYKYVSVSVLSGSVSINGYEMKKNEKCKVFSSEKTGLVEVKTESFETIWKKKSPESSLFTSLYNIFQSEEACENVYNQMGFSTIILYIKKCPLPPNIEFVKLYQPQAFTSKLYSDNPVKDTIWFADNKKFSLQFGMEVEEIACKIAKLIRSSQLLNTSYPRILVYGPRNSGKSTLLKYLINKLLPQFESFYYLDTDPGQPEFTPPGVVSLTAVDQPILGPPFFHLNKNSRMIFTGDVSPSFIDMYNESISLLMNLFSRCRSDTLFVNTMGWLEGTGLQCLINTIIAVQPTILIEIIVNDEATMFDYRDYLSDKSSQYFPVYCKHEQEKKSTFSPKEMRELSLLSYLGRCQPSYLQCMPINEFMPYCVSWKKIAIFIFPGRNIPTHRMVQALNGSIVALCCVSENYISESDNKDFPLTLLPDPKNECLAYGLVQAVDETYELLNIISPLNEDELRSVNAIIKGNIMVPNAIILKQEQYGVELPNTNVIENISNDEDMDVTMVSLKYCSESENDTPEIKQRGFKRFSSAFENLRKPAAKRYNPNFKRKSMN